MYGGEKDRKREEEKMRPYNDHTLGEKRARERRCAIAVEAERASIVRTS